MSETRALSIIPRSVEETKTLAELMAKSTLLSPALQGKAADVFVSIMAGMELGMQPMASVRSIHLIKGKPVLSADAMVGVALGSGLAEYFSCISESADEVTYETKRKGSPVPQRCTWNMADAKRAGLNGENWSKYPRAMLKARCKAALARDVYPDVLAGCYDPDEIPEQAPAPTVRINTAPVEPIQDAEIVEPQPDVIKGLQSEKTEAGLKTWVPILKDLPEGALKAAARAAYVEHLEILRIAARDDDEAQR